MSNFLVLFSVFVVSACSSIQTVSTNELELRNLVGEWRSSEGSQLNIYCSGAVSYEIKGYYPLIGETKSTCSGCVINEIQSDKLILGPIIATKFKVTRWPYQDGNIVKMVAEEINWVRESVRPCR